MHHKLDRLKDNFGTGDCAARNLLCLADNRDFQRLPLLGTIRTSRFKGVIRVLWSGIGTHRVRWSRLGQADRIAFASLDQSVIRGILLMPHSL